MKKIAVFVFAIIATYFFTACKYLDYGLDEAFGRDNSIDDRASYKDITNTVTLGTHGNKYNILIATDLHFGGENSGNNGGRKDDKFFDSFATHSSDVIMCIVLGDIAEHGKASEMRSYNKNFVNRLKEEYSIPTFTINGNHDLYNNGFNEYKNIVHPGTTSYHFETANMSYYFIDSASGVIGAKQFNKLRSLFRGDNKNKITFMHVPIYAEAKFYFEMQNTVESNKIISLFNKNKVIAAFCGHDHDQYTSDLGHFNEYVLDAYLEHRAYYIVSVDENTGHVSRTRYYYD